MKKIVSLFYCLSFIVIVRAQNGVGIGTTTPTEKLQVIGNVKADSVKTKVIQMLPNAGSGKVMVSDANGNGSWQGATIYTVGLQPELGGYVFYLAPGGKHGLVSETEDQGLGDWYSVQNLISDSAYHNTLAQKFTDWRLPTKYELNLMYVQRAAIGGFPNNRYWSSTENDNANAWIQDFANGNAAPENKVYAFGIIRPVRTF